MDPIITTDAARRAPPEKQRTKQQRKADRIKERERFRRVHRAEKTFARQLRAVAKQVGVIVRGINPRASFEDLPRLKSSLGKYAELLRPWAEEVSKGLIDEVARRDERAWSELGREIGQNLREGVRRAPVAGAMAALQEEQVRLITSLPLEASERVHNLTLEAMTGGTRARELAKEIRRTGEVTASRAMLIARTETTRTATAMVQARAQHIGSEGYIWRTAKDADVRELHRHLEGQFIPWDEPPVAGDKGERAHAGAIYNCRCWPEPVIPDEL